VNCANYHRIQMRTRFLAASLSAFAGALGLAFVLGGCQSLPPSKPEALWTPEEARGARVYREKCARCHYPTTTQGLRGPGLQAITKIKAMPSGAPPTEERLTETILHGRLTMPATPLDDAELHDLLAYLHTL
jgi:mono/diheme cytochrome c family protein